jgi:hypothetical protein
MGLDMMQGPPAIISGGFHHGLRNTAVYGGFQYLRDVKVVKLVAYGERQHRKVREGAL